MMRNVILVGDVRTRLHRDYLLIEVKPEYAEMARQRIEHGTVQPEEVREAEAQLTLFDISNVSIG